MTTTIFTLMACIGFIIFIVGFILMFKSKKIKKSLLMWTAGQILVLPLATQNVIEERLLAFWITFGVILVATFIGICYLSKD